MTKRQRTTWDRWTVAYDAFRAREVPRPEAMREATRLVLGIEPAPYPERRP